MSPVLPFEIFTQIIEIVGGSKDRDLLKNLALVSPTFLHICSEYLFATVKLHHDISSSSRIGFVKLLKSRPDVVKHIRKLTYIFGHNYPSFVDGDPLLPPILPGFVDDDPLLPPIPPSFVNDDPLLPPISPSFVDDDPLLPSVPSSFVDPLLPPIPPSFVDDDLLLPPVLPSFVDDDPLLPPILPSFVDNQSLSFSTYLGFAADDINWHLDVPFPPPIPTYNSNSNYQSSPLPDYLSFADEKRLLSSVLPNFLRTIPHLSSLTINASNLDWKTLDSSLRSAFLHLMHLPTMNHIGLSFIENFPLSSLTPSVNLLRLDIYCLRRFDQLEDDDDPFKIVQSEVMPKLREFYTLGSSLLTRKLLRAERQDGRPAFDLMNLTQLSFDADQFEDEWNLRYLLQNAKSLEKLSLRNGLRQSIVGLHDILSPSARTLKVFELTLPLEAISSSAELCVELEAIAGHNVLEALNFGVGVDGYETEDTIGSVIQKVEEVLIKPGWSTLKQVSFNVEIACCLVSREDSAKLAKVLQSLPDKYLTQLSKKQLEFKFSAFVVKCAYDVDSD